MMTRSRARRPPTAIETVVEERASLGADGLEAELLEEISGRIESGADGISRILVRSQAASNQR